MTPPPPDVAMDDGDEPRDFALHASMWGFDTGKVDRIPYRIIRYRSNAGERADSESASLTDGFGDDTGAGVSWSEQELNLAGAAKTELALVVGECVPEHAVTGLVFRPVDEQHQIFDPTWHTTVGPVQGAYPVVRRLQDRGNALYRLLDKQNGLCRIAQLPKDSSNRVVWYREWTHGGKTRLDDRKQLWSRNIAAFIAKWLHDNAGMLLVEHPRASHQSAKEHLRHRPELDPFQLALSDMVLNTSAFARTGDRTYLYRLSQIVDQATGRDRAAKALAKAKQEEDPLDYIRPLFHSGDRFDEDNAEDAVQACEKLFPGRTGIRSPDIDVPALLEMGRAIRGGVLDEFPITEPLYRPMIVTFCNAFHCSAHHTEGDRDARLMAAYKTSVQLEEPSYRSRLTINMEEEIHASKALHEEFQYRLGLVLDAMRDFMAAEQRELGRTTIGQELKDLKTILHELASTKDWQASRDLADDLAHQCFVRSHHACTMMIEVLEELYTFLSLSIASISERIAEEGDDEDEIEDDEMGGT